MTWAIAYFLFMCLFFILCYALKHIFMLSSPAVWFLLLFFSKLPVWYELNIIVFRCVKKTSNSASRVSHNVQSQE